MALSLALHGALYDFITSIGTLYGFITSIGDHLWLYHYWDPLWVYH